jgi:Family of unknown function (DUF6516)
MRLHEVLARFSAITRSYEILQYEIADPNSRLKLKIVFANGSELYVRDILLDGRRRKYAFHWQERLGRLDARWDNAARWPEIETFPHHKHIGKAGQVIASEGTTLEEVLAVIRANM